MTDAHLNADLAVEDDAVHRWVHARARSRLQIEADLRSADRRDGLGRFCRPIVAAADGWVAPRRIERLRTPGVFPPRPCPLDATSRGLGLEEA